MIACGEERWHRHPSVLMQKATCPASPPAQPTPCAACTAPTQPFGPLALRPCSQAIVEEQEALEAGGTISRVRAAGSVSRRQLTAQALLLEQQAAAAAEGNALDRLKAVFRAYLLCLQTLLQVRDVGREANPRCWPGALAHTRGCDSAHVHGALSPAVMMMGRRGLVAVLRRPRRLANSTTQLVRCVNRCVRARLDCAAAPSLPPLPPPRRRRSAWSPGSACRRTWRC